MTDDDFTIPNSDNISPADIHPDAYLRDANLSGADLPGANLRSADLRDANLSGADLPEAALSDTTLSDADLSESHLINVDLTSADLSRADLSSADLSSANLPNAELTRSTLTGAILYSSDLSNTDLLAADLSDANLSNTDLTGANLNSADLTNSDLTGANLSQTEFLNADLSGADLSNSDLTGANFSGASLERIDLCGTNFTEAELSGKFDYQLDDYIARWEKLREDAQPYLNYEIYLTRPAKSDLTDRITTLQNQAESELLQAKLSSIATHLDEYDREFVSRQRETCASLFSDIGSANLDLTTEQERAVIRNGIYNQVIAAAGTGKTLTLTTRVAYLINQRRVDPDRILVVTYTKEATEEMQQRLANHFGITDVQVKTVHAFGHDILKDAKETFVETIDENGKENFIDRQIQQERDAEASTFLEHYYEFLHFDETYHTEADFETKEQYVQARIEETYTTLRGTDVKSRAEKLIADFLYTHRIKYRYEDRATWADRASEKAGYAPDFYLTEHDVYIEHWGIDESGSIAPWFSWSSEEYREKMQWARDQFEAADAELIGSYEFEHGSNRLKQALRHRLSLHGIELDRMDFEELVNTVFDYDHREGKIHGYFIDFIEKAKRFDVMPDEIEEALSPQNPRQYHFGKCGIYLFKQYARYLSENQLIDYPDMIQDAVDLIQENPETYQSRHDHLLVDEFQDIGKGKLALIQELTGPDAARLFAVGDDWQSIYSFQGAATEYFVKFVDYLGDPVRTDLTANFRSPPSIVEAGNHLIERNTNQLSKTVHPRINWETTPRVHTLRGYNGYLHQVRRYAVGLVQQYLAEGADPGEIMVLCRFDDAVPYLDKIKRGLEERNIPYVGKSDRGNGPDGQADNGVSVYSLYQAKGREAKHVILVHTAKGTYGFPPENREKDLLEPVQPFELGGLEEERRAFYVAMTRAERSLDLLTQADQESQFLEEIADFTETVDTGQVEPLDDVGERMTVEVRVEKLSDPSQKKHQQGIVADKFGGSAQFVSWESTDPPTLEEGEWYRLTDVCVKEYQDEKELLIKEKEAVRYLLRSSGEPETAALSKVNNIN